MLDLLKSTIKESPRECISFRDFMELCLYHPQWGYYMKPKEKIGKAGDFYTSSHVHSVFAEVIVQAAIEIYQGQKVRRTFCEMGAGTGIFAKQFLDFLQQKSPEIYTEFTYFIIEKSEYHRTKQKANLQDHLNQVLWIEGLNQLEEDKFDGILFSNELFDAFPVYLVEKVKNSLCEVCVTWSEESERLEEKLIPLTNQRLVDYLERENLTLREGQRIEIPLDAIEWFQETSNSIAKGIWFIIDYGYTHDELMSPSRRKGSLRCYYKHQMDDQPLDHPGAKDITYHIHFDSFVHIGAQQGWRRLGFQRQDQFLLSAGIINLLQEHQGGDPFTNPVIKKNRAIQSLIHADGISGSFHVLTLGKGDVGESYSFLAPFTPLLFHNKFK